MFPLLHQFFEYQADTRPNNIALICSEAVLTYEDLEQRANRWAHLLQQHGVKSGDIIGLLLTRSVDLYAVMLAILKIGAAYLPFDPDYPAERIQYMLSDCQSKMLITASDFEQHLTKTFTQQILCIDKLDEELQKQSADRFADAIYHNEQLCYVIYTSGSTGKPKGVEITHKNVCNFLQGIIPIYAVSADDRIYQGFSIAFDASVEEIWLAFATGATLVVGASNAIHGGASLVEFLNLHEVSILSTVPTLLSMLDGNIPSLRLLILGGEVCPAELVARWRHSNLRIINTYGPTETTIVSTYYECLPDKPLTIGRPLPNYQTFIFNEHLQPVSKNEIGELYIGGASVARGYVNQPVLTQQKFIIHPENSIRLYRTGDLACYTDDGDIQYMGRADEQIKLRGYRIELSEIEAAIKESTAIKKAVVALKELTPGVQSLIAYLILKDAEKIDLEILKQLLHARLPEYMVPSLFEIIQELPLLPSGKIDRKSLPTPKMHNEAVSTNYLAPRTEIEKKITAVWEELFKHKPISITADFFHELGGHSLFAAKAVSMLRKDPAMMHVSMLDLYENPTIEQLAKKN